VDASRSGIKRSRTAAFQGRRPKGGTPSPDSETCLQQPLDQWSDREHNAYERRRRKWRQTADPISIAAQMNRTGRLDSWTRLLTSDRPSAAAPTEAMTVGVGRRSTNRDERSDGEPGRRESACWPTRQSILNVCARSLTARPCQEAASVAKARAAPRSQR
jgi:hypothetical protein